MGDDICTIEDGNMSNQIYDAVQDAWTRLDGGWKGEHAEKFRSRYYSQVTQCVQTFDSSCQRLQTAAEELEKQLDLLEASMTN